MLFFLVIFILYAIFGAGIDILLAEYSHILFSLTKDPFYGLDLFFSTFSALLIEMTLDFDDLSDS